MDSSIAVVPGVVYEEPFKREVNLEGSIRTELESRGLKVISRNDAQALDYGQEVVTPSCYSVLPDDGFDRRVFCEMSATSRVGHLQFTYSNPTSQPKGKKRPYILIEAARPSILTSTPTNITYPPGYIKFSQPASPPPSSQSQLLEVCGYSTEHQDSIITPVSGQTAASQFKGYYSKVPDVAVAQAGGLDQTWGPGSTLESTARRVHTEWAELLDRIEIKVGGEDDEEAEVMNQIFWMGLVHSLQYPSEQHEGQSYTGYSIWDTYRAIWALQILLVPERIPGMVRSML